MAATIVAVVLFLVLLPLELAAAQQVSGGVLRVTVVDASGAVLIGATVTVTGIDDTNKGAVVAPVMTSDQGVATIPGLVPGRYAVEAAFSGFDTRRLPDVRVRNGENRQVLLLQIEGLKDTVVVE